MIGELQLSEDVFTPDSKILDVEEIFAVNELGVLLT